MISMISRILKEHWEHWPSDKGLVMMVMFRSKWVITPVISGLTLLIPFITGVITHLLSGMNHQVLNHPFFGESNAPAPDQMIFRGWITEAVKPRCFRFMA